MPGVRKRRSIDVSDSDEPSDVSYGSARKRVRNASSDPSSSRANGDHGEYVYQPGSLVRVKLTNFVTYTAAEFHLGPSLNMIIGPNGTGKSTLVCAICLGLGWSPQHLGRAKEIGEFVKHGSAQAEIEIELAAATKHEKNPIIRRVIRKEGNKSAFFIDGRITSQKEAKSLAERFSIQINNLCQFLPQDRVVEFARIDPVGMLGETLRAAASVDMVQWHDELKELRTEEKGLEKQQQNEQELLKALQTKQNAEKGDVDRYRQRQELVTKSETLEKCRPFIQARVLKDELDQIKANLRTAKEELDQYSAQTEPARLAQVEMESYRDQLERISTNRKHNFDAQKVTVEKLAAKIDKDQQSLQTHTAERNSEIQAEKQRRQDIKRIEGDITRLKHSMENNIVEYDQASFESRQSECRAKRSVAERKVTELMHELRGLQAEVEPYRTSKQNKVDEKKRLGSHKGQQDRKLLGLSRDTHAGWKWLEENMDQLRLKGKVYGPPIIECSVSEAKYADAVESQLRLPDLTAITCTNAEDSQLIQDKLVGSTQNGGLGLHQISVRTSLNPRSYFRSKIPPDELTRLGFEGWLSDFIQGPDAVLAMLCEYAKIHFTAFTPRSISNEQFGALQRNDNLSRWIAGREVYQIARRREYGATSTSVNMLKKATYFTEQPANAMEMQQLDDDIREIERNVARVKEVYQRKSGELKGAKEEGEEAEAERRRIQTEQDNVKQAHAAWQALPRKIAAKETELADTKRLSRDTSNRIKAIQSKYEDAALGVARDTIQYVKEVTQLRTLHESFVEAEIRLVEAKSEVEGLKNDNREINEAIQRQTATIEQLKIAKEQKSTERRRVHGQATIIGNSCSDEEMAIIAEHKGLSPEDLENQISGVRSRLELITAGNPRVIQAYEERKQTIQKVEQTITDLGEKLEQNRSNIQEIRDQWEPRLDAMVAQINDGFSHNFQQIGCAGQVSVKKDEDFNNWAIQIEVSFREGEQLAVLDSRRQSGGERAVSTIFYLMALQGLARSPFRVVDEINQGMDPRNERMVHERMVDIACREHTSQYFLITPKLLNDLKYHPKMKVHCIASGEHVPDQRTNLNFQSLAELALKVRKGPIASV